MDPLVSDTSVPPSPSPQHWVHWERYPKSWKIPESDRHTCCSSMLAEGCIARYSFNLEKSAWHCSGFGSNSNVKCLIIRWCWSKTKKKIAMTISVKKGALNWVIAYSWNRRCNNWCGSWYRRFILWCNWDGDRFLCLYKSLEKSQKTGQLCLHSGHVSLQISPANRHYFRYVRWGRCLSSLPPASLRRFATTTTTSTNITIITIIIIQISIEGCTC